MGHHRSVLMLKVAQTQSKRTNSNLDKPQFVAFRQIQS